VLSEAMILFSLKNLGHIAFMCINKIFICYILHSYHVQTVAQPFLLYNKFCAQMY